MDGRPDLRDPEPRRQTIVGRACAYAVPAPSEYLLRLHTVGFVPFTNEREQVRADAGQADAHPRRQTVNPARNNPNPSGRLQPNIDAGLQRVALLASPQGRPMLAAAVSPLLPIESHARFVRDVVDMLTGAALASSPAAIAA